MAIPIPTLLTTNFLAIIKHNQHAPTKEPFEFFCMTGLNLSGHKIGTQRIRFVAKNIALGGSGDGRGKNNRK